MTEDAAVEFPDLAPPWGVPLYPPDPETRPELPDPPLFCAHGRLHAWMCPHCMGIS